MTLVHLTRYFQGNSVTPFSRWKFTGCFLKFLMNFLVFVVYEILIRFRIDFSDIFD